MPVMKSEIRVVNGYRTLYMPEHPRAMQGASWGGYVYEHVVVAEKALSRSLRDDEVVHHLDGNRANNRSENLLVLERSQHGKLHAWLAAGAHMRESLVLNRVNSVKSVATEPTYCLACGRCLQQKQEKYCSPNCANCSNRKVARPSKKQLLKDINSMSMLAVGRKYGVSDNAVRKWRRAYKLL